MCNPKQFVGKQSEQRQLIILEMIDNQNHSDLDTLLQSEMSFRVATTEVVELVKMEVLSPVLIGSDKKIAVPASRIQRDSDHGLIIVR